MAGLFSRIKVWLKNENIKAADLNAEFDNIINNIGPTEMSGYSTNVAQMKIQRNPGTEGSENLAQTTADEITAIRYVLNEIIGQTYWYDPPASSIQQLVAAVNQGTNALPPTRIVSGLIRASSNQPAFLVAAGAAASVTLKATATNFSFRSNNIQTTLTSDITKTNLALAPSSATALVNDILLGGQAGTNVIGENSTWKPSLIIDSQSGAFSSGATVGTYQAFKIVHSATTEYFIGFVQDANTITKCYRGFFFNSSSAPILRVNTSDEDTITLMKLHWVFVSTSSVLSTVTNMPIWSFATPTSPSSGDMWFDMTAKYWKTYNGSSFVQSNTILVGLAICDGADGTSSCVASRSFEFYAPYDSRNTFKLEIVDNNTIRSTGPGAQISVAGNLLTYGDGNVQWVQPTNFETGVTLTATTTYYLYIKDTGDLIISNIPPYFGRTIDLLGAYHPYNPWRFIALAFTDGSSHFYMLYTDAPFRARNVVRQISTSTTAIAQDKGIAVNGFLGNFGGTVTTSLTDVAGPCQVVCNGNPIRISFQPTLGSSAASPALAIGAGTDAGGGIMDVAFSILRSVNGGSYSEIVSKNCHVFIDRTNFTFYLEPAYVFEDWFINTTLITPIVVTYKVQAKITVTSVTSPTVQLNSYELVVYEQN